MNIPKTLQSSKGNGKLSRTVKGILIGLIPLIIAVFEVAGLEITEETLTQIIQNITAIIAAVVTVYGLVMKVRNQNSSSKK